jgi:hypothetical protein
MVKQSRRSKIMVMALPPEYKNLVATGRLVVARRGDNPPVGKYIEIPAGDIIIYLQDDPQLTTALNTLRQALLHANVSESDLLEEANKVRAEATAAWPNAS